MKKKIVILGSTGSIGKTLINILTNDRNKITLFLLTINTNYKELLKQVKIFDVKNIIINDKKTYIKVKDILKNKKINIYNNFTYINKIFKNIKIDYTMSAISGFDGLKPTLDIIKFTKKIAIANKESIICGWSLIDKSLKKNKVKFIPVDSEHFSIWSLTNNVESINIEKVFITASGGPFNRLPIKKFKLIKLKDALNHPSWTMGKKISIDSATMMNKVFEVIEAKKIFKLKYNQIEIIVHPKSYVHAMIKFSNGLVKILVHETNMRIPIFNSLYSNFEKKISSNKINFNILNNLNFKKVDKNKFSVVKLINNLPEHESLYETILVSANDRLVKHFLEKKIDYIDISKILLKIIKRKEFQKYKRIAPSNIDEIRSLNQYVSLKIDNLCV